MTTSVAHETAGGNVCWILAGRDALPAHSERIIAQPAAGRLEVKGGIGKQQMHPRRALSNRGLKSSPRMQAAWNMHPLPSGRMAQ